MHQWMERIGALLLVAAMALGTVSAASAQGPNPQDGAVRPYRQLSNGLFQAVADATGLAVEDVWAEVYDGRTLAEVAEAGNADPAAIVADVAAEVEAEIAQAVADGSLTGAQADRWLDRLDAALDHAMYFTHAGPGATVRIAAGGVHQLIEATAAETGLTRLAIWQALEDGQTLADLAAANGSSADAVVERALAHTADHLDVAAFHGRISEDQRTALLDQAAESYPELVNQALPAVQPLAAGARIRIRLDDTLVDVVAEMADMRRTEVVRAWVSADTLADVIEAEGLDAEAVIAEAEARATDQINEAVANGSITQEQADAWLAGLHDSLVDVVNGAFRPAQLAAGAMGLDGARRPGRLGQGGLGQGRFRN